MADKESRLFYRRALSICLLMILQQLILSLITIIDNVMVGRFGDVFVSSAAIVNRLFIVPSSFLNGILAAGAIFLAQYIGTGDHQRMKQTYRFSLVISAVLLLPFIAAGLCAPQMLVRLFAKEASILEPASVYLWYLSLSMIPYILSQAVTNAMRAVGQVRLPLLCCCITVAVKIVMNFLLLYSPLSLGMAGAGLAMLICRLIEALLLMLFLKRRPCDFNTRWRDLFQIPKALALKIAGKLLPIGLNELMYGLGLAVIFKGYSAFSAPVTAGYSVAMTYYELFRVLFMAMGTTLTIIVGPHLGQGRKQEAKQAVIRIFRLALILSLIFGGLIELSRLSVPILYAVSPESLAAADSLLKLMGLLFPLATVHFLVYFVFRSGGDSRSIFLIDSLFMWCVPIPLLFFLTQCSALPIETVYFLVEISYLLKCLLSLFLLKKERWLNNLTADSEPAEHA